MRTAIGETDRRREIQVAYNREHGITPETVQQGDLRHRRLPGDGVARRRPSAAVEWPSRRSRGPEQLEKVIVELEEEMLAAAEDLRFEEAARIRDELKELRRDLEALRA